MMPKAKPSLFDGVVFKMPSQLAPDVVQPMRILNSQQPADF